MSKKQALSETPTLIQTTSWALEARTISLEYGSAHSSLTKKAEPPPTRGVNRDSGTDSANGGWLRRLVRPRFISQISSFLSRQIVNILNRMNDDE